MSRGILSRRAVRLTAAAGAATLGLVALASGTQASSLFTWVADGHVTRVADGDTFLARIPGEDPSADVRVRMAGIQSMERGECHAIEAQRRLERLIPPGTPIVVKAQDKSSTVPNGAGVIRPLRYAFTQSGVDLQLALLRGGYVIPDPIGDETAYDVPYSRAAQVAAARGLRHWDTDYCGVGPQQSAQLKLMVNYNADGNDKDFPERRYARVLNVGTSSVDISGWHLRTAKHASFRFPTGTVLAPGGAVVVRGQDRAGLLTSGNGTFYWNGSNFPNPDTSKYGAAGAYLFDPDGDIRTWTMYPCQVGCAARWPDLTGRISMRINHPSANPGTYENVQITNTSSSAIDLSYYVVDIANWASYEFPRGTIVSPGQSVRLYTTKMNATYSLRRNTGNLSYMPRTFDLVTVLRSHESTRMSCLRGFTTPVPC